jgi:signal transduction histidine kinase
LNRIVRPVSRPDAPADQFLTLLSGPNGLDLVVELAHDLRSPLTSILFLAEALHQGQSGPVTEEQRRSLALIYSAALSLCTAATDVLELARGGRRLLDSEPTSFSVSDVLLSVRNMILPLASEKGLDVRLVHPAAPQRVGHAHALSRVLLNLGTNAVKFTESGHVEIATHAVSATRLEFSVSDTGKGIEPGVLRTLYEPFRRVAADRRHSFSSSGLGLAICRKLLRSMGSELKVETGPDGSRFHFSLDLPASNSA